MQTRALVDFGELSLNRAMRVYGPVGDLSVFDGRYYPSKAPLMSFAAVPVYAVLRALGRRAARGRSRDPARLLLAALPHGPADAALAGSLERLLAAVRRRRASQPAVTWTYALGTLAFSYSLLFMSHQTTATLLLAGFYLCWRVARGERAHWWLRAVWAPARVSRWWPSTRARSRRSRSRPTRPSQARVELQRPPAVGGSSSLPAHFRRRSSSAGTTRRASEGFSRRGTATSPTWRISPGTRAGSSGSRRRPGRAFVGSFFSPLRGLFAALASAAARASSECRRLWRARREHARTGRSRDLHGPADHRATSTSRRASATPRGDGRPGLAISPAWCRSCSSPPRWSCNDAAGIGASRLDRPAWR